ncbi:Apolipoprotein of lipid transfer particle-I/II [Operophtera brumata]|uniref:Apolipoprotein of lipid transfer particle-I/II n=1 Tax=Operophtera brumata TaxID=104452 RepID=A0A0L7LFN3_OPEBR|nr:Apolipoprotein of lipid transfer particle-I/II [Operophtera brumata]
MPLKRLSFIKGDTDFVFGPKTGYLLCKYELPDMKGEGDLKWSFLLGDLIGANASFGYIMSQRVNLLLNIILPKPNVDVHTLYVDGFMGTPNDPTKILEAEYRTDHIDNKVVYRWDSNGSNHVEYALTSPLYANKTTLRAHGSYQVDMVHGYKIVKGEMFKPGHTQIGEIDINNVEERSDNKVDLFWPDKSASVNTTHVYSKSANGFTQTGVVYLSVPLNTQHLVNTDYYYVQGSFNQLLGKSGRNLDLSTTDIEDVKQATVFHLTNATKFNVSGKLDVTNYDIGKNLKLDLIHGNRTWAFDNKYESFDKEVKQGSKVETESQQLIMNVWWPLRTFNLVALYHLQDTLLDGKATLNWNVMEENKTAELRGVWENPAGQEGTLHKVDLALSHPSFRKNEHLQLRSILTDHSNGPVRDYSFALTCTHPSTNLDLDMKSDVNIHMNGTWDLTYPEYQLKTFVLRPTGNDTGLATLFMNDRSLVAHFNSTDDISYHLIGRIIDARSAKFDAWRDFDDVTTVDVASYLRLNHSRLMTSKIAWRPQIFTEVKSTVVYGLKTLYSQINDTLVILKEAPMEAHLALKNIWSDAKPRVREFLDDLNDLHVIKDDLDEFEKYLNQSYNSNDFYVKNVVEFTYNILDEMAIRNHLESLPGIVNDMWGMMGNTSRSIKDSLTYVVDTIKMAYTNFLHSVNKALEADFMELVSGRLEAMILQYDNFIRDLHLKLLEYWEVTWVNATSRLATYWHELLKSIEPLFFKVLHYTESFVFSIGKGKYSKKIWTTIWNKIEKYIPFKDEFTQLYTEFRNAWQNFLKTKHVVYTTGEIIYAKVTDMAKTALQYEELHRTPKTNFIFDPRVGEIILEQKLPFSWHAFNRTPDFTEVSEYRAVRDFMDEWLTTNKSIWSYYYEIRPYMDFNNLLPPFEGMAMMTGQGTLVTFDKRVFTVSEAGTFLLTKDYKTNNFTLLMESNEQGRYNLVILTQRNLIHIDIYKAQVSIDDVIVSLPALADGWLVDRQTDRLSAQGTSGLTVLLVLRHPGRASWHVQQRAVRRPAAIEQHVLDRRAGRQPQLEPAAGRRAPRQQGPEERHAVRKIDATPFYTECFSGISACSLANAYLQLCAQQHIPTHVPDHCHQCTTPQGDIIEEGEFHALEYVPKSTDVVFIIEAQYCNKNMRKAKNMDLFVEAFDTKLQANGLSDNRYSIVGFGGRGIYRRPRALYLDYSTIYHNLMENSVTLHILMDDDFMLSKKRVAKYLFGVDSTLAYTNKDYERLVGDAGLKKQVKLPKEKLGLCTSLAMETNGNRSTKTTSDWSATPASRNKSNYPRRS